MVRLDLSQEAPLVEGCPKRGENPVKMAFSNFPLIWRFREVLGVSYQDELQAKIKLIFFVLYKKIKKWKNGVMGCSRPFAQKKRTYNSFREELAYLDVTF